MYDTCLKACGGVCLSHVVRKVILAERRVVRQQAADTGVSLGACLPLCFGGVCGRRRSLAGYPAVGAYRIRPLRRTRRGRMWNMYSPPMVALGGVCGTPLPCRQERPPRYPARASLPRQRPPPSYPTPKKVRTPCTLLCTQCTLLCTRCTLSCLTPCNTHTFAAEPTNN